MRHVSITSTKSFLGPGPFQQNTSVVADAGTVWYTACLGKTTGTCMSLTQTRTARSTSTVFSPMNTISPSLSSSFSVFTRVSGTAFLTASPFLQVFSLSYSTNTSWYISDRFSNSISSSRLCFSSPPVLDGVLVIWKASKFVYILRSSTRSEEFKMAVLMNLAAITFISNGIVKHNQQILVFRPAATPKIIPAFESVEFSQIIGTK